MPKNKTEYSNKDNIDKLSSNISKTSFLKTEPETQNYLNNQNNENTDIKQKEVDEIVMGYLNLKTKLNKLWNKLE